MQQTDVWNSVMKTVVVLQMTLLAAIFGFFFAFSVTVMLGLDRVAPTVAVEAMNAINTAVRNPAFASAFFGPVIIGPLAALMSWESGKRNAAMIFLVSWIAYVSGCFLVTAKVNVPMNRELLSMALPDDPARAQELWVAFSGKWSFYNHLRTGFAGLSFLITIFGFYHTVTQDTPANQRSLRLASPATLQSWNLPLL